jgi:phage/plasmid-associated DNA primase
MFKNLMNITNQEIVLTEKINLQDANRLLYSDHLDTLGVASLEKYLKEYKKENKLNVSYKDNQLGRLKIKATSIKDEETLMTMPCMYNTMKAVLCKGIYYDVDICNAHPTLLSQLCEFNNIECPKLNHYIKNRQRIIKQSGKNKNEYKKVLYKMMFNRYDKKYDDPFLNDFNNELNIITKKLLDIYPSFINPNIHDNQTGQAMAILCQQMEKLTLLGLYQYCKENKFEVGALIHDGLHISSKPNLIDMEKYIKDKLDINIKLEIKEFQEINMDKIHFCKNEVEGSEIIIKDLQDILIRSNNELYILYDNVWYNDEKKIKFVIKNIIKKYDILIKNSFGFSNISKSSSGINKLVELILDSELIKEDYDIENKLFNSNLKCICFNNGFYNMEKNKFYKYENNNIYTRFKLSYDYEEPTEEDLKEVNKLLFDPVFGDKTEIKHLFNNYVARSIAGCYEDKDWLIGLGERDSGKGSYMELCKYTFEDYVKFTNAENFKYKENVSDVAKSYSWLVRLQGCRLLVSNEFEKRKNGGEVNGNMIKKICSGGDPIEARVNNKDEIEFKLQCKYMALLNDIPEITPSDAKERLIQFNYPYKFVDKDDKRCGKKTNLFEYRVGDENIKSKLRQPRLRNAFFKIIQDYYKLGKPIITDEQILKDINEIKEEDNDEEKFKDLFEFTMDDSDYIKTNDIKKMVQKAALNLSATKYNRIIRNEIGDTLTSRDGIKVRTKMKKKKQEYEDTICDLDL